MGCGAWVHEKTDKRQIWAYYLEDGWYLFTPPEHYQTHMCRVKGTKREQLTDTLQLSHKHITNPTIIHADKVMNATSACAAALRGVAKGKTPQKLQDLQQIVELAGRTVSKNASAMQRRAAQHTAPPPRVQHTTTQITQSMTAAQAPTPRMDPTATQPVIAAWPATAVQLETVAQPETVA